MVIKSVNSYGYLSVVVLSPLPKLHAVGCQIEAFVGSSNHHRAQRSIASAPVVNFRHFVKIISVLLLLFSIFKSYWR